MAYSSPRGTSDVINAEDSDLQLLLKLYLLYPLTSANLQHLSL